MTEQTQPMSITNEQVLQAEIVRLNKIIQALMNRAEHNASMQGSDFNLFQTAITLEDQVRLRTRELEVARLNTEKITRDLRERENRYRLLVVNSPVSIHEIDLEGRITSMSPAGLLMRGVKEESEVIGSSYLDAVSDTDRERIAELLAKAYAGETTHFEFKVSGAHGKICKSCFVPIKNKNGNVEKLMGITEDITERKHAEEELQRYSADLEKKNQELQEALTKVKQLTGMLPICASCKKVRDDKGYWSGVETYVSKHTDAVFSHGLCPECEKKADEDLARLIRENS